MEKGWRAETAGPVSFTIHPFDDKPIPPRKLEKMVRRRSRSLAKELRKLQYDKISSARISLAAAHDYVSFARATDAPYFVKLWEKLEQQLQDQLAGS